MMPLLCIYIHLSILHFVMSPSGCLQDVMHVFHALVTGKPELLSSKLREPEMLQLLLRLENSSAPSAPLANEILKTLGKERLRCHALRCLGCLGCLGSA